MRPLAFQVLRALSHQHFVSGVALAKSMGVSRSAISDALRDATGQGIEIFKLTRRGYRLAVPLDLLDLEVLRQHLGEATRRVDVDIVEIIGSTNTELAKRAAAGAPSGSCIAAEIQTDGRGRRGRFWKSGLATSLTFSLLWRFDRGAAQLGGLSLVVGLAIVRALRKTGVGAVGVKWPNDIVLDGKKLGGVLIETQGDMLGPTAVVIGVGLNVHLPELLSTDIDQAVTDVQSQLPSPVSRSLLLATLLRELVAILEQFSVAGFPALREEWIGSHALHNRSIQVMRDTADTFEAVVRDVAADGSLIVEAARQRIVLTSAEISVRDASTIKKNGAANTLRRGQGMSS
jgi:BirA family biotin operon repressor/biotin-[acetyl-CoA-carboxylase] ligase